MAVEYHKQTESHIFHAKDQNIEEFPDKMNLDGKPIPNEDLAEEFAKCLRIKSMPLFHLHKWITMYTMAPEKYQNKIKIS